MAIKVCKFTELTHNPTEKYTSFSIYTLIFLKFAYNFASKSNINVNSLK